jgi:hypothetical protein
MFPSGGGEELATIEVLQLLHTTSGHAPSGAGDVTINIPQDRDAETEYHLQPS